MVAVRFATETTRPTTLRLLTQCLVELGGAPGEVLTDRDPALVIGATPSGRPVFAPEWVDLAEVLGIRPRACRPYRAKTKGKVERVIRELKEDFLAWATGQPMPRSPMLADYDRLAATWCTQVVIDELGYLPMDQTSAHWVFQVISRRYERGSIVLTSNRGFSDWGAVFADQVVAAAILDRLLHHATVINIKGKSYRMRRHADALDPSKERPML
jgi:IstB-like ATP binding protein